MLYIGGGGTYIGRRAVILINLRSPWDDFHPLSTEVKYSPPKVVLAKTIRNCTYLLLCRSAHSLYVYAYFCDMNN